MRKPIFPRTVSASFTTLDVVYGDADGNVTAPADLGLIVNAKMAGGSVNDAGCTSVVTVNYTVIPQMAGKSVQTNTVSMKKK